MLRYWKLIFISLIIVASLGTYYVQNALAKGEYPEFVLKAVSGDEKEVEGLTLIGEYGANQQGPGEYLEITREGSIYQEEMFYINQLLGVFRDSTIERFQKEYRNFMRGKEERTPLFFESDEILAYAGLFGMNENEGTLEIEILDKETKDKNGFQVEIPEKENYQFMQVQDVQLLNHELIVVTKSFQQGSPAEMTETEEIHVYHIDIESQQIVSDEVILSNENRTSTKWFHIGEVNGFASVEQDDYLILRLNHMKGNERSSIREESEFVAYHYETNESVEVKIPAEVEMDTKYVDGSTFYFVDSLESKLQIKAFHIESKEINTINIQTTEESTNKSNIIKVKDEKLYIANFNDQQTNIYVLDLATEELVYEGKVDFQHPEDKTEDFYFNLYDMVVENE